MRLSWSSVLKRYSAWLIIVLLFLGAIQSIASYIISFKTTQVADKLSQAIKQDVSIKSMEFSIFKGIEIKDLSVASPQAPQDRYLRIERLQIKPALLASMGNKKFCVGKVIVIKAMLHISNKSSNLNLLNIFGSDFNRAIEDKFKSFNIHSPYPQLIIHDCQIIYGETVKPNFVVDLQGRTNISGYNQFKSKGNFQVKKPFQSNNLLANIFSNAELKENLDYELEVWQEGKDLVVSDLKVRMGFDVFSGQGRLFDFMSDDCRFSLRLGLSNFSLENIRSISDSFSLSGPIALNLFLDGPLNNLAFRLDAVFLGCSLKDINKKCKLNFKTGNLILANNNVTLKETALFINDRLFKINADYFLREGQAYLAGSLFSTPNANLEINFKGQRDKDILNGDLYLAINTDTNYRCNLDNLTIQNLGLDMPRRVDIQKANFESSTGGRFFLENLRFNYHIEDGWLRLNEISGKAYGGEFNGWLKARMQLDAKLVNYNLNLKLRDMDAAHLENDLFNKQTLSGDFKANILLDSDQDPPIKINIQLLDGSIKDNPLLIDLADFMRLDAIRNISFSELNFSQAHYASRNKSFDFNLANPDILLVSKFDTDNKGNLRGYLSVIVFKKLLEESDNFRRLINFVKERSDSLNFEFDLGGKINAPRFLWRKSAFRDKLIKQLPGFIKESLEEAVNEEINKLFGGD